MSFRNRETGEIAHAGRVLEYPVYHAPAFSSDYEPIYARVILPSGQVHDVAVGTVSYASSWHSWDVTVDATEEAKAEMRAYEQHRNRIMQAFEQAQARVNSFHRLRQGDRVRFWKGRKVKTGTITPLTWFGPDRYKEGAYRAGVDLPDKGRVFSDADNITRVHSESELAELDAAWDAWTVALAAQEDLWEAENNERGGFDASGPAKLRHYHFRQAVERFAKDWYGTPDQKDLRNRVLARVDAMRTIQHQPNAQECQPALT